MNKGKKWTLDAKTREWREGPAQPKLQPENLRNQPGELVTEDIDDPSRIHAEDPEHIVEALRGEFDRPKPKLPPTKIEILSRLSAENTSGKASMLRLSDMGLERRQLEIDIVRFRIIFAWVSSLSFDAFENRKIDPFEIRHVWFPRDRIGIYEWRPGPGPHGSLRPKYLKYMDLEIDLANLPKRGKDLLKEAGVDFDEFPAFTLLREKVEAERTRKLSDFDS